MEDRGQVSLIQIIMVQEWTLSKRYQLTTLRRLKIHTLPKLPVLFQTTTITPIVTAIRFIHQRTQIQYQAVLVHNAAMDIQL